jgi:hypothetical protein
LIPFSKKEKKNPDMIGVIFILGKVKSRSPTVAQSRRYGMKTRRLGLFFVQSLSAIRPFSAREKGIYAIKEYGAPKPREMRFVLANRVASSPTQRNSRLFSASRWAINF